jgi:hypothetical protein
MWSNLQAAHSTSENYLNESSLIDRIKKVNQAIGLLGRTSTIVYHDYSITDLLEVQSHFRDSKIEVYSLPCRPNTCYMVIEVGKVKLISSEYQQQLI